MATKGTAKTTGVYNVTEMLKKEGLKDYSSVQGYTTSTGTNTVHFIAARKRDDEYKYTGDLSTITCIAYIGSDHYKDIVLTKVSVFYYHLH